MVPLNARGVALPSNGVGWAPSPCGGLPYPPSGRLRPQERAAGEVLTEQSGEEGGVTTPVVYRRPDGTPPQPPVDIVGHSSRPPGQPAPTGHAGYEAPRADSIGIPAAPPANGPGGRFAPPAPPARHLPTAAGQFRPAGYALSPPSYDPGRLAQAPHGAPELSLAPAPTTTADRSAETLAGSPGPVLSRPAWATSDRPVRPPHATPVFNVSIPPPVDPGRSLPPPHGAPVSGHAAPSPAPTRPAPPPDIATAPGAPGGPPYLPVRPLPPSDGGRRPGFAAPALPIPGGSTGNGGSPAALRRPDTNGARHHGGAPHTGDPAGGWRPLPEPALASPQRPAPNRTVGRLASLGPEPESQTAGRPAPTPPRTAQDFSTERVRGPMKVKPATRGLRQAVRSLSFGVVKPGPGRSERRERELVVTATTPIATCRRVAIVSRKGGIGKTTTTLMLGHTFSLYRRDRVIALDANPDAGSLAYRVHRETDATVTQLLRASERLRRYSDMRSFTNQASTRLEVLASDDDPTISVALGEPEYRQVLNVLEHHYNLILMDTGTGILDSATQGILRMADQIVVCAAPGIDASRASSLTLDWLDEHGYHDLVADAVVVINQVRGNGGREMKQVVDHFAKRCRAVVKVPWDAHLAEGLEVEVEDLRPRTRAAYLSAVAAVARSFSLPSRHR